MNVPRSARPWPLPSSRGPHIPLLARGCTVIGAILRLFNLIEAIWLKEPPSMVVNSPKCYLGPRSPRGVINLAPHPLYLRMTILYRRMRLPCDNGNGYPQQHLPHEGLDIRQIRRSMERRAQMRAHDSVSSTQAVGRTSENAQQARTKVTSVEREVSLPAPGRFPVVGRDPHL